MKFISPKLSLMKHDSRHRLFSRHRILLVLTALLLLLSSCGKALQTRYYLLEYVPMPPTDRMEKGPWPYTVRVKDFSIAEAFRRNQIVYRQSAHEMRFYNYELWAVRPEYLVTDMVFRHVVAAELFKSVNRGIEQSEPDFYLTGEVHAIEEYDNNKDWYAHLAITFKLTEITTGKDVWSKNYDYRKKVARQEPVYVVRELSYLLEAMVNNVVMEIDRYMIQVNPDLAVDRRDNNTGRHSPDSEPSSRNPGKNETSSLGSGRTFMIIDEKPREAPNTAPDPLPGAKKTSTTANESTEISQDQPEAPAEDSSDYQPEPPAEDSPDYIPAADLPPPDMNLAPPAPLKQKGNN